MIEETLIASLVALVALLCSHRADYAQYSIFTVGVFRRINRRVVTGNEYDCYGACTDSVEIAERRRWFKELVVGGVVLARFGGGTAYYCEDHASFEVRDEWDDPIEPQTQRLAATLAGAFVVIVDTFKTDTSDVPTLDSPAQEITADVSDALSLLPVAMLVLCAAVILFPLKQLK